MKKSLSGPPPSPSDFAKRANEILAALQKELLPEHASDFIAINVETGDYVLSPDRDEVWRLFRRRWPNKLAYVIRVDGSPVVKFHGFVPA